REGVVVGGDHPLAVIALLVVDGRAADEELASLGLSEVLAIAAARGELSRALGELAIVACLHRRELRFKLLDHLGSMLALSLLLGGVVTDDITAPSLPIPDHHLLDAQVVANRLVASGPREDLVRHLVAGAHARREDVLAV